MEWEAYQTRKDKNTRETKWEKTKQPFKTWINQQIIMCVCEWNSEAIKKSKIKLQTRRKQENHQPNNTIHMRATHFVKTIPKSIVVESKPGLFLSLSLSLIKYFRVLSFSSCFAWPFPFHIHELHSDWILRACKS